VGTGDGVGKSQGAERWGVGLRGGNSSEKALPEQQLVNSPRTLEPGDEIVVAKIRLAMQRDGNLVAYDENNQARWASRTAGTGARADFQPDGNLVVHDASNKPVWASNTSGHESAVSKLQDDGNIVILDGESVLWAAGTGP
jgi:eukaryotic-like serine/threonine-protein kinase